MHTRRRRPTTYGFKLMNSRTQLEQTNVEFAFLEIPPVQIKYFVIVLNALKVLT